jgi:hypothetical protein
LNYIVFREASLPARAAAISAFEATKNRRFPKGNMRRGGRCKTYGRSAQGSYRRQFFPDSAVFVAGA